MKSKPVKHKTTNTFRFVSFAERINSIDIRHAALYHIENSYSQQPGENDTHFYLAMEKWHALNLTENFKKFKKEVFGIITVPQLIHKKNEVLDLLEKYFNLDDPLCLQPLLEILVSVVKDLRSDFYQYFPKFLDILIKLLNTKDAERLEWTLICLAFLFKILKPHLKKDIGVVVSRIVPLLSENKPQYINNFAAESFAFVARDIRDKKKFIETLLKYLKTNEDTISGCGHLLFEIIKGVGNKFHSCIDSYLPLLLQELKENIDNQEILFKVLTQTIEDSLQTISQKEFSIFWDNILKYVEEISREDGSKGLEYILRLSGQIIEHNNGKYLLNPHQYTLVLVKVICHQSSESVLDVCASIGALLLLSSSIKLSQEHAGILVKVLLPLPFPKILINFVQNVTNYSQFDMHILPHYLNFVIQSDFDVDAMSTLSKICLTKSPLSKNGLMLFEWVKYPLDFGKGQPIVVDHFKTILNDDLQNIVENPTKLMNVLFCLPHIEKLNVNECIKILSELISKLLNTLSVYNLNHNDENKLHCDTSALSICARKVMFILAATLECAIHISSCKQINDICNIEVLLSIIVPCAADQNYLVALHILDLYLTAYECENKLTYQFISLIDSYLRSNVSSPFHIVRLLTTHIYKLFENIDELKKTARVGSETEIFSIFSKCHSVECITPSIQEYRSQIATLQKMTFNTTQYEIAKETNFHLFSLEYMLGSLYVNFKLLWEPVSEFIAAFGNALPIDEFWPVFYKAIENSFKNAKCNVKAFKFDEELDVKNEFIIDLYAEYNNIDERLDFHNYRNLILKIMTNCIDVCEARNRDVVTLFLKFIDEEYRRNNVVLKINVEKHNIAQIVEDGNEGMEVDIAPEPNDLEIQDDNEKDPISGKIIFRTLINMMQVMSQFKNPKALYKEASFWELHMEFLKHKNPGLQKYALDCVLNYKNKSVTAYKSNLYNLVDDKKFKDELAQFKITDGSDSIHTEDRVHVVPIILRILYGKMTSKLGADKKGGGQTRRALIMRYLSGCNEGELIMFIEMAFIHFKDYMAMEPEVIMKTFFEEIDLKSVNSPGKINSVLNLFDVVREHFAGSLSDNLLFHLFKIFYAICSHLAAILAQVDRVHIGYVKVIKHLRVVAVFMLGKLFEQFDKYPWRKDELYVIFETLVWPLLPRLHIESIHNPTALLKLFNIWCLNPRYYILLITCPKNNTDISALPEIFKLLLAPKSTPSVVNAVLDMVEKLLTLTEDEEDKEIPPIESFNTLDVKNEKMDLNFGSKILLTHLPHILEVMKRRISKSAKSNTVNKRDLLILSRVTELVTTPEMCDDLLNLLLPILVKKVCMNMAEENMEHAVTTIINLLSHSTNPQQYIKNIAVLFNKVTLVEVRKLIVKLLFSMSENTSANKEILIRIADVISEMNAFNKRWIDQPDFDKRLDAYKKIYQMLESNEIDVDLAILIVNNCFYFIRTEKDIGLRDSAGLCLKRILPNLLMKYRSTSDGQFFVRDTVLSLISSGIRDKKNDVLRNECLTILGELVRECPDADVVLSDLASLANKEDIEVDFFENSCHLQLHRRVRALLKFCKVARKMTKCPTPRTLTNFILPLASMYICDDTYSDKNTLIDACIEVISTCCRLLPWYHYEVILKLYLNKMKFSTEHQKQLTRILIGVLDAFHFDFSKVKDIQLPKSMLDSIKIDKNEKKKEDSKIVEKNPDAADENENAKKLMQENENTERNIEENENTEKNIEESEDIQDALDVEGEIDDIEEKEQRVDDMKESSVPAFERVTNVSPSVASRIIKSLTAGLLPQLNRAIGKLTEHEESHKVNRRRMGLVRQEEDMLRVPVALALVKLLQRLPGDMLKHQLPGIIIKLCSFLKSPLKQVRIAARDIVKKVMITVGPEYLGVFLEHLTLLLTRGFQVHVLAATIHTVLDALKADFKPGDINKNLDYILKVCTNDLFGQLSEEKEIEKLHYKTPEAKPSKKSYVTLTIVAQNITEQCLIKLLLPFKEVLQKHNSKKVVVKVQDALMHISSGLVTNKSIDTESLFVFLHGVASESIPEFVLSAPKRVLTEVQKERILRAKPDCFIIPETPKRNKESQMRHVRTSSKTNAHVLVEFSMNILYIILKREKVPRMDCKAFVDPQIPLLVDAIRSDHVKVITVALKCIATLWTIRLSTPMLEEMVQNIVKTIFEILHKYATFEISKQNDNYHLVKTAFKAVTVLIRNVKYYTLEAAQLKILLLYAEGDCQNDERQANSFSLLKAILEAKLVSTELHEVMHVISKICILSESARSREEARGIFVAYLTNYSPGKRLEKYIKFFLTQLNYEMQHGRESSLKFLEMIINKLDAKFLAKQSEFIMVSLGACMMNDISPECRRMAAGCIEALLRRSSPFERNKLFQLVLRLFEDTQPIHFELASQLCIRFVNVECENFKPRLEIVLSILSGKILFVSNDITEGRFVKIRLDDTGKSDEKKQKEKDHSLIQILNLIDSIAINCSCFGNNKYARDLDDIGQYCQVLLAYPHAWVRLRAVKIIGHVLSHVDVDSLNNESERGFIYCDTEDSIRSLVLDLCAQFIPNVGKDMADQTTEVMFLILKIVHSLPRFKLTNKIQSDDLEIDKTAKVNIRWILYKLRRAINAEVAKAPTCMNIRSAVFTMWLHFIGLLETDDLNKVIDVILPPLVREISTGDATTPASVAKQLAGRLGKKLRRKIGDIEYGKLAAAVQTKLNIRRAERKKILLQEKVNNPEKAAKRKLQLREKKKQAKRVKLDSLHGKRPKGKKRKAEDIDIEDKLLMEE